MKTSVPIILLLFPTVYPLTRAHPLDNWTVRYQVPADTSLLAATYANNQFVTVGRGDTIESSVDGIHWVRQSSGTTNVSFNSVAYGGGVFVVVGGFEFEETVGTIVTSNDGRVWSPQQPQTEFKLNGVAYAIGEFIAVGENGLLLSSTDGFHWAQQRFGTEFSLNAVAYGRDRFVIVGHNVYTGDPLVLTSSDGVNWVKSDAQTGYALNAIAYGNGSFVAVGANGTAVISEDGANWTPRSAGTLSDTLQGITYAAGQFVAVGRSAWDQGTILTSNDGVNWLLRDPGCPSWLGGTGSGNGQFIAVGQNGTILISTNAMDWTVGQPGTPRWLGGITYADGEFVAVGDFGLILTSTDGLTWSPQHSVTQYPLGTIGYGNSQFIAAGAHHVLSGYPEPNGVIATSADGTNWVQRYPGTDYGLGTIAYGNGKFVAVSGGIDSSEDGINWIHKAPDPTTLGIASLGIAFGQGQFVAVGFKGGLAGNPHPGAVLTSVDGEHWIKGQAGTPNQLSAIVFGGDQFVAVGGQLDDHGFLSSSGTILTSPDGASWTVRVSGLSTGLRGVAYGNGSFVAVGGDGYPWGILLTSSDAVHWVKRSIGIQDGLSAVGYGNGHFVVLGEAGTILVSDDLVALSLIASTTSERVRLSISGPAGVGYTIESSVDLVSWRNLTNLDTGPTGIGFLDLAPAASGHLFYRTESKRMGPRFTHPPEGSLPYRRPILRANALNSGLFRSQQGSMVTIFP